MTEEQEIKNADYIFVENLIFECAIDSGFRTDGENFFAGHSGEVEITEELWNFTALMAVKMKLLLSPNTKAQ